MTSRIGIAVLGAWALGCLEPVGKPTEPLDNSPKEMIEVLISSPKQDYLAYEPVVVRVQMKNLTPRVHSYGLTDVKDGLGFRIQDPDGRRLVSETGLSDDAGIGPLFPLNPNAVVEVDWLLDRLVDADNRDRYKRDFFLHRPGPYVIRGNYREWTSNDLTIQIKEPTGVERKACEIFRGIADLPSWLPADEESFVRCRELIEAYPGTPYGQYARYAMATYLLERDIQVERKSDLLDQALQMFAALLKDSPTFPLGRQLQYKIAKARYHKGRQALSRLSENAEWLGAMDAHREGFPFHETRW